MVRPLDHLRQHVTAVSLLLIVLIATLLIASVHGYIFKPDNWVSPTTEQHDPDTLQHRIDTTYTALQDDNIKDLDGRISLNQTLHIQQQRCERNASMCPDNRTAAAIDTIYRSAHPHLTDLAASYLHTSQIDAINSATTLPPRQNAYKQISNRLQERTEAILPTAVACRNQSMNGRDCFTKARDMMENGVSTNSYIELIETNISDRTIITIAKANNRTANSVKTPHVRLVADYQNRLLYDCTAILQTGDLTTIDGIDTPADTRPQRIEQCIQHHSSAAVSGLLHDIYTSLGGS